jgi:glycerol-3-phosphate O-acyltransferase
LSTGTKSWGAQDCGAGFDEGGEFELNKPTVQELSAYNMHEDQFDPQHCKSVAPEIERMILKSYCSIGLSEQSKKKILDLGTTSIMYASLHRSHFDYIATCGKMFLEGLPCPRTIAGSNLLDGIIGWSIKQFTGIDMTKWGAIPFERDSLVSRNLLTLCSRMETFLRSDKPILVFPEVETFDSGNGNGIKTGRTYSGKIRKFASAFFSPAINASKEGKKVYIVPMAVSYDFVAEDAYFSRLTHAHKMKNSDNSLGGFAGNLYYIFLESHFFYKMYSLGKGKIYIDTGKPIPVEPNASKKELANLAQQEAARCYRVTIPALVSHAISNGATSRDDLQKSMERYAVMLNQSNANFQPPANLRESIDGALHGLEQRKIISNHKGISVRAPEIINYYANTIAHHFENGINH